jgi:DNA-binding transcriptional LysR family regulator
LLPEHFCQEQLHDGRLVRLLPQWSKQSGLVHLVFTTKRGLTPAVRALIDHLAIGIKQEKALGSPSEFTVRPAAQPQRQVSVT